MTRQLIGIKVTVLPDTDAQAALVVERLSNVLVGLAIEGIDGQVAITPYDAHDPVLDEGSDA